MLLRRIKQHVTNENWFAVCVDFFIVVVGVYVGLEVSNINEQRQERNRAVSYLERIRADLEADLVTGAATDDFWQQVIGYGEAAIRHAENGALADGSVSKTLLAYYQASQVDPYSAIDTTYLELKGAAEFRLIPNTELLAGLSNYYILSNGLQANHLLKYSPEYREHIRGLMPWDIQTFIWAECHAVDFADQFLVDCDVPVGSDEGLAILQTFVGDAKTVRGLRFWIANLSVARGVLASNLEEARGLIATIDATLAETS
jgi:hypothetical protein